MMSLHYSVPCRNGVVRYESVMRMRKALDQLEKQMGITEREKGGVHALLTSYSGYENC